MSIVGIDIEQLLAGAKHALDAAQPDELLKNRPALYSALLWSADTTLGAKLHVLMPYSDRLREFAEWYRQLWAESLGKEKSTDGRAVNVGPTPIAARGATDQHSQLQLYAEGPDDKSYLFLAAANRGGEIKIPGGALAESQPELAYLAGHGMGELLDAELTGTTSSLVRRSRPVGRLTLAKVSAEACVARRQRHRSAAFRPGNDPVSGSVGPYSAPTFGTVRQPFRSSRGRDASLSWSKKV